MVYSIISHTLWLVLVTFLILLTNKLLLLFYWEKLNVVSFVLQLVFISYLWTLLITVYRVGKGESGELSWGWCLHFGEVLIYSCSPMNTLSVSHVYLIFSCIIKGVE